MKLNDRVYDVLKWIVVALIPASSALYFGLSQVLGFPYGEEVVGTLALVATFLGSLIGLSTVQYNKAQSSNE